MTWSVYFMTLLIGAPVVFLSGIAVVLYMGAWRDRREVDRLLKREIGKTLSGIHDGLGYDWEISYDHNGESWCNATRYGVAVPLSQAVNLITRRAIEWGCDITAIKLVRTDIANRIEPRTEKEEHHEDVVQQN